MPNQGRQTADQAGTRTPPTKSTARNPGDHPAKPGDRPQPRRRSATATGPPPSQTKNYQRQADTSPALRTGRTTNRGVADRAPQKTHHNHQRPATRKNRKPDGQDPPPPVTNNKFNQEGPGNTHKVRQHRGRTTRPDPTRPQPTPKEGGEQHPQKPPKDGHGPRTTNDGSPDRRGGLQTTPTAEHTPTTKTTNGKVRRGPHPTTRATNPAKEGEVTPKPIPTSGPQAPAKTGRGELKPTNGTDTRAPRPPTGGGAIKEKTHTRAQKPQTPSNPGRRGPPDSKCNPCRLWKSRRPDGRVRAHKRTQSLPATNQLPFGWTCARPEGTQPLPATNTRRRDGRVPAPQ